MIYSEIASQGLNWVTERLSRCNHSILKLLWCLIVFERVGLIYETEQHRPICFIFSVFLLAYSRLLYVFYSEYIILAKLCRLYFVFYV